MNRVIVVGSPRTNGRSAALAEELFEACIEECPDDQISLIPLSSLTVLPCEGCNFCMKSEGHACHLEDDMIIYSQQVEGVILLLFHIEKYLSFLVNVLF